MSRAKKILVAGGTFCVALGIGFVMQNGDALAARFAADTPAVVVQTPLQPPALSEPVVAAADAQPEGPALILPETEIAAVVALPEPEAAPLVVQPPIQLAAASETGFSNDATPLGPTQPIADKDCTVAMDALTGAAAMVSLTLNAPCNPDAVVTIHHQGMMFTALTDATGHLEVTVPALNDAAVFMASFDGGSATVATTLVPDLASFDRAVLQWQGSEGFALHAYEFGAGFDDAGHVWDNAPGAEQAALDGSGGFLVRLGDTSLPDPLLAEVYTFPSGTAQHQGDVALTAEATVTDQNCGRDVSAQSIQVDGTGEATALDLSMTMPGCDAVGEFLEIKPMFDDIRVAAR